MENLRRCPVAGFSNAIDRRRSEFHQWPPSLMPGDVRAQATTVGRRCRRCRAALIRAKQQLRPAEYAGAGFRGLSKYLCVDNRMRRRAGDSPPNPKTANTNEQRTKGRPS
jgi:hypothetical protein